MHGKVRVGISGWTYEPWRGVFYPEKLPQKKELHYASHALSSIEINGTFYSLQRPKSFEHWTNETPDDFVFSVKAPQFITHIRRLRDVEGALANFFASGLLKLGKKLGPVLWQFPPSFKFDPTLTETFFARLPVDTDHAVALGEACEPWMKDRTFLEPANKLKIRHAMEIRNKSFAVPEFIALLRKYRVALVCADTVSWPRLMDVTSDFVYCRMHGSEELYASGYDDASLDQWADRVVAWARGAEPADAEKVTPTPSTQDHGRDVYVYFDNDLKVRAPFDAQNMMQRVSKLLS